MGKVRIGCLYPLAQFLLTPISRRFFEQYPGVSSAIEEGNMVEMLDMLKKGQMDLAKNYDAHHESEIEFDITNLIVVNHERSTETGERMRSGRGYQLRLDVPYYFEGIW